MRVLLLVLAAVVFASGQPTASIELPRKGSPVVGRPHGMHAAHNRLLVDIVSFAYKADPLRIIAPDWFYEARYDFAVEASNGGPEPILRRALEEKFALIAGWETRPVETWVLERLARGSDLTLAGGGGHTALTGRSGAIKGTASPEELARLLQTILRAEVMDETGTGGSFRFSISWRPGDEYSLVAAFREAGLHLHREHRDGKVLVVYSAYWPDAPKPCRYACEPRSELKAAIEALDHNDIPQAFEQRLAARRKLLQEYPEDIFAEMAAQAAFRDRPELTAEWENALQRYQRMQDRIAAALLEARLLMKVEPARSTSLLTRILHEEPDFGWAHLSLAEAASTAGEREDNLRRFRELCPSSLADAPLYGHVRDPELLRAASRAFARILAGRTDSRALAAFSYYWRIRRRAPEPGSPTNWLQLDLARIRALNRTSDPAWIAALEAGYELLGDPAALASLRRQLEQKETHR